MLEVSYSSFIKFNKHLDIPFSDIDVAWLKRYEKWMKEQNLSVSTISTRIRHLRAVFNLAITEHSIKSDCYPFLSYKVSKLNKQTAKRALNKQGHTESNAIQRHFSYRMFAIDIFIFAFECRYKLYRYSQTKILQHNRESPHLQQRKDKETDKHTIT